MRWFTPLVAMVITWASPALAQAPTPGRNVNMVTVDPYLQKQNEPSLAVSSRNPCHVLAGANDYRTVNIPGLPDDKEVGDAWVGLYKSTDCGQSWLAELMPGYPQDPTTVGRAQPVYGFTTGADPVVRPGVAGTFYYSFIVFNRGTNNGKLAVARFIDTNDREAGDTFQFLGQTILDNGSSGQFIDKPAMATALGTGMCTMGSETVPATTVYAAWSVFVGNDNNIRSKLYFARSGNCALSTDGPATKLSESFAINQGAAIGVDPTSPNVYVVWRQFTPDNVLFAKSTDGGRTFTKAELLPTLTGVPLFEQSTTPNTFRTKAYPSVAVDQNGTLHVAIAARVGPQGDSRIVVTSLLRGATGWTPPVQIEQTPERGHQFMPALTYAGGKLNALWYDLRDDIPGVVLGVRTPQVNEAEAAPLRHTMDVRGAEAPAPAVVNGVLQPFAFQTYGVLQLTGSERVSQYPLGNYKKSDGSPVSGQLQFNRPNLRLYAGGTWPFIGDYIDVAGLMFVQDPATRVWSWNFNDPLAAFHAAWTDNRDARDVPDPTQYNAPGTIPLANCTPLANSQAAARNANVYTSRIAPGIELVLPGNAKPATTLQRAFSLRIVNHTKDARMVHLSMPIIAAGATASFGQFGSIPTIDVRVGPRSSAARTIYVSSGSNPYPRVLVDAQSDDAGLPHLSASAIINRDGSNPTIQNPQAPRASTQPIGTTEIHNPDIQNPDIQNPDIQNPDIQNPDIQNPDIQNPDIQNPDIQNPDIQNPDIQNPDIQNPDIQNPDIQNPDIQNPDIQNPDIQNPDIQNPDIQNGSLTDATVAVTNTGNTTSSYQVTSSVSGDTSPFVFQLIGSRIVRRPSVKDCRLTFARENQILFNEPLPDLTTTFFDPNDPSTKNTTLQIAPGDTAYVTLRVYDPDPLDDIAFCPKGSTNPKCNGVVTHGVTFLAKAESANALPGGTFDGPIVDSSAPDLTIAGAPGVTPTTIVAGDQLTVSGSTLANSGTSAAIARGGFDTGYFLSADGVITTADVFLARTTTIALAPGDAPLSLDRAIATPDGSTDIVLEPGTYRLGLLADMNGIIAESNESNNSAASAGTITVVPPPQITTATLPDASVNSTYSQTLAATGGVGTLTWSWAPFICEIECAYTPALPPGLTLSTDGVISGTPTAAGLYGFIVTAIDSTPGAASSTRHRADQFLSLRVVVPLVLTFTTQPPEAMTTGSAFTVGALVRDASGASIPGALVTLQLVDNEEGASLSPAVPSSVANADGFVTFSGVSVLGAGTYRLRAFVNQIGFAPGEAFSNVFQIFPSTGFVGPVGGNGGEPFGPPSFATCNPGWMATAIRGRAGDDIDRTELWCSNIDGTFVGAPEPVAVVGGNGGVDYGTTLSCPSGSVITGLHGRAGTVVWGGTVVDTLGVTCTNLATGAVQSTPEVGNSAGAPFFALNCPAGQHVVGLQGRQGALLDQIAIICQ